jgi:hypothetical protein
MLAEWTGGIQEASTLYVSRQARVELISGCGDSMRHPENFARRRAHDAGRLALCGRRQNNSQRVERVSFNIADGTSEAATMVHPFVAGVMQHSTSCKQTLGRPCSAVGRVANLSCAREYLIDANSKDRVACWADSRRRLW